MIFQPLYAQTKKSRIPVIGCLLMMFIFFVMTTQAQIPIPQQKGAAPVPVFIGNTAVPHSIQTLPIPMNPFMGSNGWSNTHNDPYMSDTYFTGGPLGVSPMKVASSFLGSVSDPIAVCITITFDSKGRIVTACPGISEVRLYLLDSETLKPLAKYDLPPKSGKGTDISAGGYFFIGKDDRAVVPMGTATMGALP